MLKKKKEATEVEDIGLMIEKIGYNPVASRVFAYLLLSEPPYQDFYSIIAFLKISKSAASTALNLLMEKGVVNYLTFNGDRKRYFQINTKEIFEKIVLQYQEMKNLTTLISKVLDARVCSDSSAFNEELKKAILFQQYIVTGINDLIQNCPSQIKH